MQKSRTSFRARRRVGGLAVLGIVAALGITLVPLASADNAVRNFSATFAPSFGGGKLTPGASNQHVTLVISNSALSTPAIGSVNVTVPTGLTLTGSSPSGTTAGNVLQLRNLNIRAGTSLNVDLTVTTPSPCVDTDYTWGIAANQTTDFSKPSQNFTLLTADSYLKTTVAAASCAPASIEFTQQPPKWVGTIPPNTNSPFGAQVLVEDGAGNPMPGQNVTIAIESGTGPSGATLTCYSITNCTVATDPSGHATFSLSVDKEGYISADTGYQLRATAGSVFATSTLFNAADSVKTCVSGPCTLDASSNGSSTSANVTNAVGDTMAFGLDNDIHYASSVCGTGQVGPGFEFERVNSGTATAPIWTITATLNRNTPGFDASRGATQWDICLGTINLTNPPPGPNSPCATNNDFSWPAKAGCAVYDSTSGLYWGDVPNAAPNVKKCDNTTSPVVLSKNKTGSGDLVIKFCAPFPWDGGGGFH